MRDVLYMRKKLLTSLSQPSAREAANEAVGHRQGQSLSKRFWPWLLGRNWLSWAAAELLPRKVSYESGRATSPLRLRRRCLRNSSAVATNKTITNVCSCYARGLPANGFCTLTWCDKSSTSSYLETTQGRSHSSAQSVTGASQ